MDENKFDLMEWAENELNNIKDLPYGKEYMKGSILQVLRTMVCSHHSDDSGRTLLNFVTKLWDKEPLTPLTGNDDEWNAPDENGISANKRCSRIIKDTKTGKCYDRGKNISFPYKINN